MRDLVTRMNTVPSISHAAIKAVVDREGMSDTGDAVILWYAPNWYRVGIYDWQAQCWEYTDTVDWAHAVKCLQVYGLL